MTLQASGTITMAQINAEFGRGNDLNSYRGTTWYTDAGGSGTFSTGAISMSDFYGKRATSPMWTGTITTNQNKLNLRAWAIANGYSGSGAAQITIASGVYIWSDDINTPALTIDGSWGSLTLINNGYIMGMGGAGDGWNQAALTAATSGGNAISLGVSCTIQNNSYIGGGGGGGVSSWAYGTGGGGAGGGAGGSYYYNNSGTITNRAGGSGGSVGTSGGNGSGTAGNLSVYDAATGGGGGRIMPGSNTTTPTVNNGSEIVYGGLGGGLNNTGGNGVTRTSGAIVGSGNITQVGYGGSGGGSGIAAFCTPYYYSEIATGGGGGWGASGGSGCNYIGGSASYTNKASTTTGGKCVNLNGYSVTWSTTGTRYGAIS